MRKRVTKHEKDTLGIDSNNVNWPGHVCNVNGDDVMSKAEREKAIEVFENSIKCHEQQKKHICDHKCDRCGASRAYNIEEVEKAIDTALETLKQEPSEDCISRQAMLELINGCGVKMDDNQAFEYAFEGLIRATKIALCDATKKLPPVTPTQKMGEWIKMPLTEVGQTYSHKCSLCGRRILAINVGLSEFPFCHCGAKMKGADDV